MASPSLSSVELRAVLVAAAAALAPEPVHQRVLLQLRRWGVVVHGRWQLSLQLFGLAFIWPVLRQLLLQWRHAGIRGFVSMVFSKLVASIVELPIIRGVVRKELSKEIVAIENKILGNGDPTARVCLPKDSVPSHQIKGELEELMRQEHEQKSGTGGKQWAGIYHESHGPLVDLQNQVWSMYNSTNTLYEGVFPSIRKFEAELVSWVLHLVHGDPEAGGGLLTSGGTESVLLGALAYRELGRSRGIEVPRIIAANTCHPAIVKACHYFGMSLTKVPVDASTGFALSARAVRPYLAGDVVCIYASAPTFPHGVVDQIEDLAALATSQGIGLHVDNCLGGILLSFLDRLHLSSHQMWDFRVPGVTSISVDIHKYGNASKGASVVVFANKALRRLTYVPVCDGCEGLYVTSSMQGARGGAIIAQAWATMLHFGESGYLAFAKEIHELHSAYQDIITSIPQLRVLCPCHACIIPIVADRLNIYVIASLMEERGWNLFTGQHPPVMSICIGELHKHTKAAFEADLREAVELAESSPELRPHGAAAVYGAASTTPAVLLKEVIRQYVDVKLSVKQQPSSTSM
mmetsp:Transcript_49385/g.105089  ORF Transcript_49385/g.105089 Transcript_49385/m.105089 type:complete len:576 (-) Transcript_49385:155-1882(-)|eukprot:CAMPEP_0206435012 /NCGR_PEP_ID=MMETSP0324_2-20121206/9565_1 /ASSEMBLY_ACC=CAM_ASM_000836 /TAXON_ID=2866 /ORGANISM="Crypthecodinium cohnii, Strain Seligo" /LENGTH=575 /DNA_ID=CAMNT_0053901767 /DNA_START=171 /DNA_END=1898 /DNA_ORIENTATION=-